MASPESSDSPQVKLIHEWVRGFQTMDLDLLASTMHKDYHYTCYPRCLGKPEENKEEWLARIEKFIGLWTAEGPGLGIHSIIDTPGRLVAHMTNKKKTSVGVEVNRESIFIADIVPDEDGNLKIKKLEDFTDSKAEYDLYRAIAAAKKQ